MITMTAVGLTFLVQACIQEDRMSYGLLNNTLLYTRRTMDLL